jgi:acyl dehydratase
MKGGSKMALNLDLIGKKSEPEIKKYSFKDCILYALGIGATEDDLEFVYEGAKGGLLVYPTFAVYPTMQPLFKFIVHAGIDLKGVLHAGQKTRIYKPIPASGTFLTTTLFKSAYDKKKAAVINVEFETKDEGGEVLFSNLVSLYCRGQGDFGGEQGFPQEKFDPPDNKKPLFVQKYKIPERQAAIYRLSGDFNPLHIDPVVANKAGFAKPILHGLCTFGYVGRAVLDNLCDKDVSKFKEISVRFANVTFPGDTLTIKCWETQSSNKYIVLAETENGVVMDQSCVTINITS